MEEPTETMEAAKISDFYNFVKFDDLVIISYPVTVSTGSSVQLLTKMVN